MLKLKCPARGSILGFGGFLLTAIVGLGNLPAFAANSSTNSVTNVTASSTINSSANSSAVTSTKATSSPKVSSENSTSRIRQEPVEKKEAKSLGWSMAVSATGSQSLYRREGEKTETAVDYKTKIGYHFSSLNAATTLGYSTSTNSEVESDWTDGEAQLSRSIPWVSGSQTWTLVPSMVVILPMSKNSREVDQLQTATTLGSGLQWKLKNGFSATLAFSGTRFFHAYETNRSGKILNAYGANQALILAYERSGWGFEMNGINRVRWSYEGDSKSSFEISEEVNYTWKNKTSVSLGHTNSGSTVKANGVDSNVALSDEDNSIIYIGVGAQF